MEHRDPNAPISVDVDDVLRALTPPRICAHCGSDVDEGQNCANCGSSETHAQKVDPPAIPVWLWVVSIFFPPLLLGLLVYRFVLHPRMSGR